jgi:hypothetical protein
MTRKNFSVVAGTKKFKDSPLIGTRRSKTTAISRFKNVSHAADAERLARLPRLPFDPAVVGLRRGRVATRGLGEVGSSRSAATAGPVGVSANRHPCEKSRRGRMVGDLVHNHLRPGTPMTRVRRFAWAARRDLEWHLGLVNVRGRSRRRGLSSNLRPPRVADTPRPSAARRDHPRQLTGCVAAAAPAAARKLASKHAARSPRSSASRSPLPRPSAQRARPPRPRSRGCISDPPRD